MKDENVGHVCAVYVRPPTLMSRGRRVLAIMFFLLPRSQGSPQLLVDSELKHRTPPPNADNGGRREARLASWAFMARD